MDPHVINSYFDRNFLLADVVPKKLCEIALDAVVKYLEKLDRTVLLKLSQTHLPSPLPDKLLQRLPDEESINKNVYPILLNSRSKIEHVKLKSMPVTSTLYNSFLKQELVELDLFSSQSPSPDFLEILNRYGSRMVSLTLGTEFAKTARGLALYTRDLTPLLTLPKLQKLSIVEADFVNLAKFPLQQLTYLNLSNIKSVGYFAPVKGLMNLKTLIMYNVRNIPDCVDWIVSHSNLECLDLTVCNDKHGRFRDPSTVLHTIVTNLTNLFWLDISGTNLADTGVATEACVVGSDIPGLVSRVNKPLEFLGLYGTMHSACQRHDIPAKLVSGDSNEKQILTAAIIHMNRIDMISKILNDLYNSFRFDNNNHIGLALNVVLKAMKTHIQNKNIQITASATLFYIVKGREKELIRARFRQEVIETVTSSLELHHTEETLMRNGYLILCQFKIPADVLFVYKRMVFLILIGVTEGFHESFVQRIAIYLLNSLACQVDCEQKEFLGNQGAIDKMLALIALRVHDRHCDDVLEVAWSSMWNVTDETPVNCKRFLDANGMGLFLGCLKVFPEKEELLRNMMGLLGNVAEVAELRPRLMCKDFLTEFYKLLDSSSDGMEVSYNAAGVLAHMAADGPECWTVPDPSREDVLERMERAIDRWDLSNERNINYRSFKPILRLLETFHTPQCQHWAVWALANLTTVYSDKYCELVKKEKGIPLLLYLLEDPRPYERIKSLARKVLKNCSMDNTGKSPVEEQPLYIL